MSTTDDEVSLVEEPKRDSTGSHTKRKSKKTPKTDVRDITCGSAAQIFEPCDSWQAFY